MKGLIKWYEDTTGTTVSTTKRYMEDYTDEEIDSLNDSVKNEILMGGWQ